MLRFDFGKDLEAERNKSKINIIKASTEIKSQHDNKVSDITAEFSNYLAEFEKLSNDKLASLNNDIESADARGEQNLSDLRTLETKLAVSKERELTKQQRFNLSVQSTDGLSINRQRFENSLTDFRNGKVGVSSMTVKERKETYFNNDFINVDISIINNESEKITEKGVREHVRNRLEQSNAEASTKVPNVTHVSGSAANNSDKRNQIVVYNKRSRNSEGEFDLIPFLKMPVV